MLTKLENNTSFRRILSSIKYYFEKITLRGGVHFQFPTKKITKTN
jgi:hypothetical protein